MADIERRAVSAIKSWLKRLPAHRVRPVLEYITSDLPNWGSGSRRVEEPNKQPPLANPVGNLRYTGDPRETVDRPAQNGSYTYDDS